MDLLLSFDSQATAVGIGGTVRTIRAADAVRVVDGILGKPRAVSAIGVAG
ncbi:hypothetical protein COMA1_40264 [Candidatus Nitrospira nitrosa]|uniref:Uncharacterized protein n=1 Tax=Candidatus Nitrospira nitrosa TaxID=1742972 RepID=A0A0S4LJN7_9BACT|nr:hypothetical protein COMA1_40264 [Candidatus Nitrospira nitrosa]